MPIYSFIISRAVDLVARKLAGMDKEKLARFTKILSEEAQRISDELQYYGQQISADIIAARLEGFLKRLKYELRNQGPDPSPNEFPIFNVSHHNAVYLKPINRLYDKKYKKPYTTHIQSSEATFPYSKQQQIQPTKLMNSYQLAYSTYPQQYYVNPSVTYYSEPIIATEQHSTSHNLHQSSTSDNNLSHSVSRSTSHSELRKPDNQTKENTEKSNSTNHKKEIVTTKRIYAAPDAVIGSETMEDLLKIINSQNTVPSQSGSNTERVVIIDRPNATSSHHKRSKNENETSLASSAAAAATTTTTTTTTKTTKTTNSTTTTAPGTNDVVSQSTNSNSQQILYQQPIANIPTTYNHTYSATTSYSMNTIGYYPYVYYSY